MTKPTINISLKNANYPSGRMPIIMVITHRKERRRISLGRTAHPDTWDKVTKQCTKADPEAEVINNIIQDYCNTANSIIKLLETNASLEKLPEIQESSADIERLILEKKQPQKVAKKLHDDLSFFEYANTEIDRLGDLKQYGLQSRYSSAVNKYKAWSKGERLVSQMTTEEIQNYHAKYLIKKLGNEKSTAHVSVRILKTIYRRAKKIYPFLAAYPDPFIDANIKQDTNKKEIDRLTTADLKKLETVKLTGTLDRTRDIFLFCYECLGIRVSDAISLKRSQIKKDVVVLNVRKTDKLLKAEITPYMQSILDKYKDNDIYVFGLLNKRMTEEQIARQIKASTALLNKDLKKIGKIAGISIPPEKMRTHLARHSLAHHVYLETNNIQLVKVICQHEDIRITENYIGRLGFEEVTEKMREYRLGLSKKGLGLGNQIA
jgi:integrase